MGIFNFFKKEKSNAKFESQSTSLIETIIAENRVSCNFTVEQQREWLGVLNKTISTIMLGEVPFVLIII